MKIYEKIYEKIWLIVSLLAVFLSISFAQQPLPTPPVAPSQTTPVSGTVNIGSGTVTANQGTPAANANSWPVGVQPYPNGATPQTISANGTTAAVAATLPGTAGKTTFLCGFSVTMNATAGINGVTSITGLTNAMSFLQPVATGPLVAENRQTFQPCVPASAANTGIVVTAPAAGTGGNSFVNAWGFQQ